MYLAYSKITLQLLLLLKRSETCGKFGFWNMIFSRHSIRALQMLTNILCDIIGLLPCWCLGSDGRIA